MASVRTAIRNLSASRLRGIAGRARTVAERLTATAAHRRLLGESAGRLAREKAESPNRRSTTASGKLQQPAGWRETHYGHFGESMLGAKFIFRSLGGFPGAEHDKILILSNLLDKITKRSRQVIENKGRPRTGTK